jgi:peptide-methionine (S)-S-oxide reductase
LKRRVSILLSVCLAASALGAGGAAPEPRKATALFAGGCFWSEESAFEGVPGVISVTSGYTGGQAKNPSYELVETGTTGHAESVEVVYDPARTTYEKLLYVYWRNVDPFQPNAQFCDHGSQYRSAIFYEGEEQRKAAEESKAKLEERPGFKGKIVTQIVPASAFYPAEEYHQGFTKKNPYQYQRYRIGCGRDRRLKEIWGDEAGGGHK